MQGKHNFSIFLLPLHTNTAIQNKSMHQNKLKRASYNMHIKNNAANSRTFLIKFNLTIQMSINNFFDVCTVIEIDYTKEVYLSFYF